MAQQTRTRDHTVRAAIALVDARGLDALPMRRFGWLLGVEAIGLYRHVSGRGDLLEAMVSDLIDSLFDNELITQDPSSWEDYLQRVATATRELALNHPEIFPLIATQPSRAPWLRHPSRSVRWAGDFLSKIERTSFDFASTTVASSALTSESSRRGVDFCS